MNAPAVIERWLQAVRDPAPGWQLAGASLIAGWGAAVAHFELSRSWMLLPLSLWICVTLAAERAACRRERRLAQQRKRDEPVAENRGSPTEDPPRVVMRGLS